jgi:DNA-binding response OmpR family regulator
VGKIIPEKEASINNSFLYREDYAAAINYAGMTGISFIYPGRPEVIILIEKILVEQGRNAIVAKTKDDALSAAYSGSYDMLVLDLNKPIICALDIYLTLKESDVLLPIVMLIKAGGDSVQDADLLRSFEITGCIFKPYDFERFFDLIQNIEIQNCA